ncbi:MAG: YcxB family protein [Lachnospiraceae bacterium]|nr:YcxB family protein [Lachnospiraceae bacterium]
MEIEFDIKINANVLYDYMLHHTYTSASGLLGTGVGALMIVAFSMQHSVIFLIAGIVILAYLPWTLFIKSRQQMLANPAFKESLHYRLDEEGITVSQNETEEKQSWEQMHKAISTGRSIIVYTSRVNASIFPKKDLGENKAKVIEIISTHMPPSKVKIRG